MIDVMQNVFVALLAGFAVIALLLDLTRRQLGGACDTLLRIEQELKSLHAGRRDDAQFLADEIAHRLEDIKNWQVAKQSLF